MKNSPLLLRNSSGLLLVALLIGCSNGSGVNQRPPAPPPGTPGEVFGLTSRNRLVSFNRDAPAVRTAVEINGQQAGEVLLGIDVRPGGATPGEIYALGSNGRIYTVNPATGQATFKAALTADAADTSTPFALLEGSEFGVDFNPVADRLRVVSNTGQNLRINVDTGATFTDGALNTAGTVTSGISAAAYTNTFAASCRTTLFYFSTSSDRLLVSSDPNAGTLGDAGALGVDAPEPSAFEIITAADGGNSALAVFNVGNAPTLYRLSLTDGGLSSPAVIAGLGSGESLRGITAAPPATSPVQAAGTALAVTATNRLVSFNPGTPQKLCTSAPIMGLQAGETTLGIDARPADGANYLLGSAGRIYTVTTAGTATLKSTLVADMADASSPFVALEGTAFGVDFNPVPDRLRVVSDTGQNLRINVDTGATTTDSVLNPPGSAVTSAAYTDAFPGAGTTTLYGIDTADRLVIQGRPSGNPNNGDLEAVGPLAIGDVQAVGGFDIDARNGTSFAALTLAGSTTSDLYSVNLLTGAATRVNTIGGGEVVRGLTLAAGRSRVYAVTADHRLVSFQVGTPGIFETDVAITGLGAEAVVGADIRPATGALVVLTDAGRLHRIEPTTGIATPGANLSADAGDMTNAFAGLSGSTFGVDFNPVVDRLRTVGASGQNLRSNADTGATTTDGMLSRGNVLNLPAPQVVAAAYTQNFAGTTSTQLYVIDAATLTLQLQDPPNDGLLTAVGPLDPLLTSATSISFDIAGGGNGLAVAAMVPAGSVQSTLYRINLATGVATAIGTVGPSGAQPLRALAIQLQ